MPISRLLPASFEQPNPTNLVINGNQMIDQRNNGSALTASASHQYATDRFICRLGTSSSSTIQQVSDAPDGFEKSMKLTIGTGASPSSSTGTGYFAHRIEGNNIAHLGWGSSGAKTVTLSFWVKSSVTGSFGVTLSNFDASRSYPSSYTISSANTWQYITVTVSGDTSGTWKTDANSGIEMWFDWGNGSNFKGTANTWAGSDYRGGATGTVNICATSSATWQITGVVLNEGSKAETFNESYAEALTKCQRYYQRITGTTGVNHYLGTLQAYASSSVFGLLAPYLAPMRIKPAVDQNGTFEYSQTGSSDTGSAAIGNLAASDFGWMSGGWGGGTVTAGYASVSRATENAYLEADAEL